jgi:sugar lactone lactonase YvrE
MGAAPDGGTTAYTPFACPPGPYPTQTDIMTTQACQGFAFNYGYNEGPTWIASQNAFFFSNFVQGDTSANKSAGDIIKVSYTPAMNGNPLVATCAVWLHDVGCNGLGVASDGNIIGACHGPRAVMKYDVVTKQATTLATMAGGEMLDAPNDLISTRNGNIYFSNTTYELGGRPQGLGFALVRIDPTGTTSVIQMGQLNGMALSPDETLLYVVQMGVWNVNPDGSLGTKTNMPGPGGDGIAMDCAGNIVNENSKYGTNAAFGGPDGKTLIAVGGGTSVKIIEMTVPGFP